MGLILLLAVLPLSGLMPTVAAAQPALLWQKTWGTGGNDWAQAVAVDALDNVYVTGSASGSGVSYGSLLKYNSTGALLWQRGWRDSVGSSGEDVAVGSDGSVYVLGNAYVSNNQGQRVLLLKYDSSGNLLWQRIWGDNTMNYTATYGALAVDSSGYIYVTGSTHPPPGPVCCGLASASVSRPQASSDTSDAGVFLLKFDSSGSLLWQDVWGGGNKVHAGFSSGVAVDSFGNIILAGLTMNGVALLKVDSAGIILWQKTWNDSYAGGRIAVDSFGNIYVLGTAWNFSGGELGADDVLLLKLDSSGNLEWQKIWGGRLDDEGYDVAVDSSSGSIYVAGATGNFGAELLDVLLLKFNSIGGLLWMKIWGGNDWDSGNGVAVNSFGDAVVVGQVSEGPPYTLRTSGNTTLGILASPLGIPNFTLNTLNFTLNPSAVALVGILGTESYAGGWDEFVIESSPIGDPPTFVPYTPTPLTPAAFLLAALATPPVFMFARRRRAIVVGHLES